MFDGQSVLGRKPHEINQMGISRVFQTPEIFGDLSVLENVMIPCFAKRDGAFRMHAIESVGAEKELAAKAMQMLEDVNMAEKHDMHAASLSRGDKRRLEMAMCLVQDPRLLLLDEPTAGMARADTNNTIDLLKEIATSAISPWRSSNTTCMSCSHWPSGLPFSLRARRWSRTRLRTSRATRRCAKPILGEAQVVTKNHIPQNFRRKFDPGGKEMNAEAAFDKNANNAATAPPT